MIKTTSSQRSTAYRAKLLKRPELQSDGTIKLEFAITDRETLTAYVNPTPLERGTILNFKPQIRYSLDGYFLSNRYFLRKMQPS